MLQFINDKNYPKFHSTLDILDTVRKESKSHGHSSCLEKGGLELSDVVFIDNKFGFSGSAELICLSRAQAETLNLSLKMVPLQNKFFFLNQILFHPPASVKKTPLQLLSLMGRFYQSLYNGIMNQGMAKKVDYMIFEGTRKTLKLVTKLGCWPVITIDIPTCPDELGLGILNISPKMYPKFEKQRDFLESVISNST